MKITSHEILLTFLLVLCVTSTPSIAQMPLNPDRDQPLEITADGSLEWKRNQKIFIARDNALAQQGDVSVAAEELTANYRDGADAGMEIYRVSAAENVILRSQGNAAHGDQATYSLDEGLAIMTGENLRMISPDQTVTAQKSFEYWITDNRLIATGRAKATRPKPGGGEDTLEADTLTAILKNSAQGQQTLETLQAEGNVIIHTPTEVITGAKGLYHSSTNKAELLGGVTITRGPNKLEGERALVDMNTNTSQLFGNAGDGRVRGIFYPNSEKKPETTQ